MAKEHQTATGAIWYEKVDTRQLRLRVAEDFWHHCSWTKTATKAVECVAMPAANGQIQLYDGTTRDSSYQALTASLHELPAMLQEDPAIVDFARIHAAGRVIKITHEPAYNRCSIALSADLVSAGFGPDRGERAVVFALGEIVEIWSLVQWQNWLKEMAPKLQNLQRSVLDALKERSD